MGEVENVYILKIQVVLQKISIFTTHRCENLKSKVVYISSEPSREAHESKLIN
jgi:hypothetical protein